MTEQQARKEVPNIYIFYTLCCDNCITNIDYCPSYCDVIEKAGKLDFDRIIKCYAKHDGDLSKVCRYIKTAKFNRVKGGY